MKRIGVIICLALLLFACNKNQKVVKTLDGKWDATSYTVSEDGLSLDFIQFGFNVQMDFENCKLKDQETCGIDLSITNFDGKTDYVGNYKVTNEGRSLHIVDNSSAPIVYTIVELSKTYLELKGAIDGNTVEIKLTKI
ncbi:MAG: lipocalin family protein [Crocinitomicaceae bacterium]